MASLYPATDWVGNVIMGVCFAITIYLGTWTLWATRPIHATKWYVVENGYVHGTITNNGDGRYRAASSKWNRTDDLGYARSWIGAWLMIRRHNRAVILDRKCRDCGCSR